MSDTADAMNRTKGSLMNQANPVRKKAIARLERHARQEDAAVYQKAADELSRSNRDRATVNLSKIERVAEDGDTVLVPGKVLGSGRLQTDVDVAALQFSDSARDAIEDAGETYYVQDLLDEHPSGDEVRVVV
ncbi:MAG: 50S ribosomal protein L18e [Candidatus Nanohaloarchaeota archaeon QJJ-5]|nr:50S ribosomal protein L18e [Candidatus Nanohaloarchaeota archaeon QJJ-5]